MEKERGAQPQANELARIIEELKTVLINFSIRMRYTADIFNPKLAEFKENKALLSNNKLVITDKNFETLSNFYDELAYTRNKFKQAILNINTDKDKSSFDDIKKIIKTDDEIVVDFLTNISFAHRLQTYFYTKINMQEGKNTLFEVDDYHSQPQKSSLSSVKGKSFKRVTPIIKPPSKAVDKPQTPAEKIQFLQDTTILPNQIFGRLELLFKEIQKHYSEDEDFEIHHQLNSIIFRISQVIEINGGKNDLSSTDREASIDPEDNFLDKFEENRKNEREKIRKLGDTKTPAKPNGKFIKNPEEREKALNLSKESRNLIPFNLFKKDPHEKGAGSNDEASTASHKNNSNQPNIIPTPEYSDGTLQESTFTTQSTPPPSSPRTPVPLTQYTLQPSSQPAPALTSAHTPSFSQRYARLITVCIFAALGFPIVGVAIGAFVFFTGGAGGALLIPSAALLINALVLGGIAGVYGSVFMGSVAVIETFIIDFFRSPTNRQKNSISENAILRNSNLGLFGSTCKMLSSFIPRNGSANSATDTFSAAEKLRNQASVPGASHEANDTEDTAENENNKSHSSRNGK